METLAVFGWDDRLPPLLRRLELCAGLRAGAVGDRNPPQLAHARAVTALPCYQHTLEMARVTDCSAALIATPDLAGEIAALAAARGATLLAIGDRLDGATLDAVAAAAARHGAALIVLRPALLGVTAALEAMPPGATTAATPPRFTGVHLRGEGPARRLLRDAVTLASHLLRSMPRQVTAETSGGDQPGVITASLRTTGGALATVTVRTAPGSERLRVEMDGPEGAIEIECTDGQAATAWTATAGGPLQSRSLRVDGAELAARQVATLRARTERATRATRATETQIVRDQAAVLGAVERSLDSGVAETVSRETTRPSLHLLPGGGRAVRAGRAPVLRVVTV